jgi:hypothetical protein
MRLKSQKFFLMIGESLSGRTQILFKMQPLSFDI